MKRRNQTMGKTDRGVRVLFLFARSHACLLLLLLLLLPGKILFLAYVCGAVPISLLYLAPTTPHPIDAFFLEQKSCASSHCFQGTFYTLEVKPPGLHTTPAFEYHIQSPLPSQF